MSGRSRKRVCLQNGASPDWRRWLWLVAGVSGALAAQAASADPQVVLPNGLPVQVKPTYSEPGLPTFSFPTGGGRCSADRREASTPATAAAATGARAPAAGAAAAAATLTTR